METKTYIVSFREVFKKPKSHRSKRAIQELKRFLKKHKRVEEKNLVISNEVNEFIWGNGYYNIPKKIEIEVLDEKGKTLVFLKGSKKIKEFIKEEKKKEKERKAKEEEKKKEKEKPEEKEKAEEDKKKLEEKRLKEKFAEKAEFKRG
jgi:ribosomal protein L31E